MSTSAATNVQLVACPAAGPRRRAGGRRPALPLPLRRQVEVHQSLTAKTFRVDGRSWLDLDRAADRAQLELVADADPASIDNGPGEGDLILARDLRHESMVAFRQELGQGLSLDHGLDPDHRTCTGARRPQAVCLPVMRGQVRQVPVVLVADEFQELAARQEPDLLGDRPGTRVGLGVVDRHLNLHAPEVFSRKSLGDV